MIGCYSRLPKEFYLNIMMNIFINFKYSTKFYVGISLKKLQDLREPYNIFNV